MPNAWCSRSYQPVPMPRMIRPSDIWSTLATAMARFAGLRYVPAVISVPSLTVLVSRARPPSVVHESVGR